MSFKVLDSFRFRATFSILAGRNFVLTSPSVPKTNLNLEQLLIKSNWIILALVQFLHKLIERWLYYLHLKKKIQTFQVYKSYKLEHSRVFLNINADSTYVLF